MSRMAHEIGLDRPRRYEDADVAITDKLRLNDIRTRAFMLVNEYRFITYR